VKIAHSGTSMIIFAVTRSQPGDFCGCRCSCMWSWSCMLSSTRSCI